MALVSYFIPKKSIYNLNSTKTFNVATSWQFSLTVATSPLDTREFNKQTEKKDLDPVLSDKESHSETKENTEYEEK